jgi:HAMP domain-containing protein
MARKSPSDDTFWQDITVPVNDEWESNGLDFVNAVQVAEMFAKHTSTAAFLAHKAERLTGEVNELEFKRVQAQRELKRLRREVVARNFKGIPKSANADMQEAFILSVMTDEERAHHDALETEIDEFTDDIGQRMPALEKYRARLKVLEKTMEWMKQYLDFDKLQTRVNLNTRS